MLCIWTWVPVDCACAIFFFFFLLFLNCLCGTFPVSSLILQVSILGKFSMQFYLKKKKKHLFTYWLSELDCSCGGQAPCFSKRSAELTGFLVVAGDRMDSVVVALGLSS